MPNATIRDVAREANVSVASVSRALNGHASVRPAMKLHVEEVATRLGYTAHAGARNLSLARTGAIGVVLPDLHGEFYSELLRGMDGEASVRGLQLLLTVLHDRPGRRIDTLQQMRGQVDGLAVMAPHLALDALLAHLPAGLPVVLLNCATSDRPPPHPMLQIDNEGGAAAVVEHLVATGRRRLVHIAGPTTNIDAVERQRGAAAAAARAGLSLRVIEGDFRQGSGIAAATALLADLDQVDAIFAANDMMALGAMVTLKRAGVAVPERIAVAGFDDIPLADLVSPALTTARIDIAALGASAIAHLARCIDGEEMSAPAPIAPTLIIRDSTEQPSLNKGHLQGEHRI